MKRLKKKRNWKKILANILLLSLALSIVFAAIRLAQAPADGTGDARGRIKSDYMLMLVQCVAGLLVMLLPSMLERRWNVTLPNLIYVLYYLFLYCAIFLGEVMDFYYKVPHWDSILHFFSGGMLGALGFILVGLLNDMEKVNVHLSPAFVALFAFCFALAAGAVWEIYEFSLDGLLGLNMQKFAEADGTLRVGRAALNDTMKDIILDASSAAIVSLLGFFAIKKQKAETAEK